MELKETSKYIAKPVRIFMTATVILIALLFIQQIIYELSSPKYRSYEKPDEQTKESTEEEKKILRIKYSLRQVLPDGTIHLVHQPGTRNHYQWKDSGEQQVHDINDNLLWQGIAKDNPYKYLSWTTNIGDESFDIRSMKYMQTITPELSRSLQIPVRSKNKTNQIWRYSPKADFFTGYKFGGQKIGYAGATGFADSISAVQPFGEFARFFAWCPKDSFSPTLLWQTKRPKPRRKKQGKSSTRFEEAGELSPASFFAALPVLEGYCARLCFRLPRAAAVRYTDL